jgi:hypothetical protein
VKKSVIRSAMVLGLAVAASAASLAACSGGSQGSGGSGQGPGMGAFGTVGTELTILGGETISSVSWTIKQGTTTVLTGTYTVPTAATSISFFIPNVPAGSGYTISLTAVSTDGTVTCAGTSAPFTVTAQATTDVNVFLACNTTGSALDAGGVLVNGTPVDCATWTSAAVNPSSAATGGTVTLTASAVAPNPSGITYSWTAAGGGTVATPTQATTTFTCPATAGTVTLTLNVGDGTLPTGATCPAAASTTTLTVTCGTVTPVDAGGAVDAGTDTGAPDSGVDSGPVVLLPCTTAGQTNCVQCQGNSNNLCSPTEALLVQQDINKGLATAAGPDPTAGCYTCLFNAGGVDDTVFGDTGHECGDIAAASSQTQCTSTLSCILGSSCTWSGSIGASAVSSCYCGTAPVSGTCANVGSTNAANGACDTQEATGLGFASNDGLDILKNFTSTTLASGVANNIFQTAISNNCGQCLH